MTDLFTRNSFGHWTATSREAAKTIAPHRGTLQAQLLDLLREYPDGLTDEQMQQKTGMNPSTQRPRRIELVKAGEIWSDGTTRPTASGVKAVVWRAKGGKT